MATLRFHIEGNWTAQDFSDYFASLNHIYSVLAVVEIERQSAHEWEHNLEDFDYMFHKMMRSSKRFRHWLTFQRSLATGPIHLLDAGNLERSFAVLEKNERLQVRRLRFASPGNSDLSGIGQAMGHVKDIVLKLIDVRVCNDERNIKNQILEEERQAAALKNLREKISILKDLGYTESEMRAIIASSDPAIEKLTALINRGLLTGVSDTNDNDKNG
jgi:hypothetical protein